MATRFSPQTAQRVSIRATARGGRVPPLPARASSGMDAAWKVQGVASSPLAAIARLAYRHIGPGRMAHAATGYAAGRGRHGGRTDAWARCAGAEGAGHA